MSIEFGFFESVEDDRLYYSDSFNKYFEGMYTGYSSTKAYNNKSSGIFSDVGDALTVVPGANNMEVVVKSGKAIVDYHWFEMADETYPIVLDSNPQPYGRYDMIVLRCNTTNAAYTNTKRSPTTTPARSINIAVVKGTVDASPKYPTLDTYEAVGKDNGIYEMPLAAVYVKPNFSGKFATGNINCKIAPVIRGALNVGSELNKIREDFEGRMEEIYNEMKKWEKKTQNTFDTWFYDVTDNLTVGGYIKSYHRYFSTTSSRLIPLSIAGYTYDTDDIFIVTFNGLSLTKDTHYTISSTVGSVPTLVLNDSIKPGSVNDLDILILKSNLSQRQAGTLSSITGDYFIYANDVAIGEAYGFKIHYLPDTSDPNPVIAYSNRNLAMVSNIQTSLGEDENEISLVNNGDGTFTITGKNNTGSDIEFAVTVSTRAFARANTYTIADFAVGDGNSIGSGANEQAAVKFAISNTAGTFTKTSDDTNTTFSITDETFPGDRVVFKIIVVDGAGTTQGLGVNGMNVTISPTIEVGSILHEFVKHEAGEFTYKVNKPVFEDNIDFIWPKYDENIEKLQLVYYILADGSADNIYY